MLPTRTLLMCAALSCAAGCGSCDPSDLRAWVEGNRDIPVTWEPVFPAAARENLIDAEVSGNSLKLRYHEGEWTELMAAFDASASEVGYARLATCPLTGSDDVGSVTYGKLFSGGAELLFVGLGVHIKSSGHFFLDLNKAESQSMGLPKGCTFSDGAPELCDNSAEHYCRFKGA